VTKHANRKARIRAAAAAAGTNYTTALRNDGGLGVDPPDPPAGDARIMSIGPTEPPCFLLGDTVAVGSEDVTTTVEWRPESQASRLLVDNTAGGSGPLERLLLAGAAAVRLPTLAIGPSPVEYRRAHPGADVFGAGNDGVGYEEVPAAAATMTDFISSARSDWRLLFVHLELPVDDDSGRRIAWEPSFGELRRLSGDELRALDRIVKLVARVGSEPPPSGLIVIAVLSDVDLADLLPATAFDSTISSALTLDYQHTVDFTSALPTSGDYLPQLKAQLHRLERLATRGAFWSGMSPKAGRIVLASVHGDPTRAILISDPPDLESWWWPDREVILRNHNWAVEHGHRR